MKEFKCSVCERGIVEVIDERLTCTCKACGKVYIPPFLITKDGYGYSNAFGFFFDCLSHYNGFEKKLVLPTITDDGHKILKVGSSAFKNAPEIETVILPDGYKEIGNKAFSNCKKLQKIELPDSISEISHQAFSNCSSLEEIIIPANVTNIDSCVFQGCTNLKKIVFENPDGWVYRGVGWFGKPKKVKLNDPVKNVKLFVDKADKMFIERR